MIKNRTAQLIFQTIYCTLGLVGCVACLGIFDDIKTFRWDFYVYFTNISNFLCLGVMVAGLVQTIKKKEDSFVTAAPALKFVGMLGILLTFLVFNIMLAGAEGLSDAGLYALCQEALANGGNYYTLHQKTMQSGMLCPILFRSYAIYGQRGLFSDLNPARDNVFWYSLGKTMEDCRIDP